MIRFGVVETEDDIVYNNSQCQLKINSGELTRGTLLMTKSEICWKQQDSENGFMIPWEKITVQAITQEPNRQVYFMIDVCWPEQPPLNQNGAGNNGNHVDEIIEPEENGSEDEGNDSDCSVHEFTEFHVVPANAEEIDIIYYIMTKFPEAEAAMDESDDDDFFDGENIEQMNLNDDDERFADAE